MNDKGDFLAGLLIGALVGALAGVLLAPAEGRATRESIGSALERASDKVVATATATKKAIGDDPAELGRRAGRHVVGVAQRLRNQVLRVLDTIDEATKPGGGEAEVDAAAAADGEIPVGGEA